MKQFESQLWCLRLEMVNTSSVAVPLCNLNLLWIWPDWHV